MHLNPHNYTLHRDGQRITLTPRAFDLLCYLWQRPGQLVSKQELLDKVWPHAHLTEGVIKVAIHEVRKALDDDANSPCYIETVHRRGYRFIGMTDISITDR